MLPYDTALDLTLYLGMFLLYVVYLDSLNIVTKFGYLVGPKERSIAPWQTAFLSLNYMADILYFDQVYPQLNDYLAKLVSEPFQELDWTGSANDSLDTLKLRTFILKKMCFYGNGSKRAGELLLSWKVKCFTVELHNFGISIHFANEYSFIFRINMKIELDFVI